MVLITLPMYIYCFIAIFSLFCVYFFKYRALFYIIPETQCSNKSDMKFRRNKQIKMMIPRKKEWINLKYEYNHCLVKIKCCFFILSRKKIKKMGIFIVKVMF